MKIGVISDTHLSYNDDEVNTFLEKFRDEVDFLIHAGDIDSIEFLTDIRSVFEDDFLAVAGNMDGKSILSNIEQKELISIEGLKIGVTHSSGHPSECHEIAIETFKKEKPDIIVFGHSHHPLNKMINNTLLFNPGSLLDKRYAPYTSYGLLELKDGNIISREIIRINW